MVAKFVKYDEDFLSKSWDWLNDPEIKFLTDTADFTKGDQKKWYQKIQEKCDYLIWGIEAENEKIGVCGLKNLTSNDCEYWGYIGDKAYWGKGIGSQMMRAMEQEAKKLKLKSIWLKVIVDNDRAIRLYQKSGYLIEESKPDLLIMRKSL